MSLGYWLSAYEELWCRFGFLCKFDVLSPNMRSNFQRTNSIVTVYCQVLQFVDFSNEILEDAEDNIDKDHFLYKLIMVKVFISKCRNIDSWSTPAVVNVHFQN